MKHFLSFLILSSLSTISMASLFADYCYKSEHNVAQSHTLRMMYIQFDVGDCLAVESIISQTNRLDLSRANIKDVKPFTLMPVVVHLDLSNNNISDIVELARAYQLESLDLSNNNIYDFSPLINLTQLKELKISGNPLDKNEYNCPTDSSNQALNTACFDVAGFDGNFYAQQGQLLTKSQFEHALAQIFENRRVNFKDIINLNAFSLSNSNSSVITLKGRAFLIGANPSSSSALKIHVTQSDNLLKIAFTTPSDGGTARFEYKDGQFVLKNIEQ
ncbi:MAG: leucine-rich repeat domain-containing protein [Saccharospirillaceae bacterium]|nr:leucine-rich repeat domain-containing protein [Pseudomonadales bacterium]NRB78992.1 leucine-rich repeat domain-containing protein [Saccharospirillaceae bacterium]